MRELISTILHPTIEGIIFVPMLIAFRLASYATSWIPGKVGDFLWESYDDISEELSRQIYQAIRRTPSLWDIDIFK